MSNVLSLAIVRTIYIFKDEHKKGQVSGFFERKIDMFMQKIFVFTMVPARIAHGGAVFNANKKTYLLFYISLQVKEAYFIQIQQTDSKPHPINFDN